MNQLAVWPGTNELDRLLDVEGMGKILQSPEFRGTFGPARPSHGHELQRTVENREQLLGGSNRQFDPLKRLDATYVQKNSRILPGARPP